ncbi:hypothetical protein DSL92_02885 [Billgrantia gudaonensis]|uniref:Uncharacterized protein n=1 Tax=Billgrantia gudaonensis TaxID=376427 RepID=A0A3S0NHK9_9GAMM|nr:hypothetical protein DSL92_02885 [Halomonas gudaonensis]
MISDTSSRNAIAKQAGDLSARLSADYFSTPGRQDLRYPGAASPQCVVLQPEPLRREWQLVVALSAIGLLWPGGPSTHMGDTCSLPARCRVRTAQPRSCLSDLGVRYIKSRARPRQHRYIDYLRLPLKQAASFLFTRRRLR